jgi:hypothetical protein
MFPRKRMLPWIVVIAWLSGVAITFWYFEFQSRRSFAAPGFAVAATPQQGEMARRWFQDLSGASPAHMRSAVLTVVHVYRAGCDCNRYTERHLAQIQEAFGKRGVHFVRIEIGSASAAGIPGWVSSLPAAFVFGTDGALLYFGPYSDAAWCGRDGDRVEGVLDRALQGAPPLPPANTAWGCFCEPGDSRGKEMST